MKNVFVVSLICFVSIYIPMCLIYMAILKNIEKKRRERINIEVHAEIVDYKEILWIKYRRYRRHGIGFIRFDKMIQNIILPFILKLLHREDEIYMYNNKNVYIFRPIYQYEYDGNKFKVCSNLKYTEKPHIGDKCKILINPENPNEIIENEKECKRDKESMIEGTLYVILIGILFYGLIYKICDTIMTNFMQI